MPTMKEFTIPSTDGVHQIYCRQWTPDGEVRGVVQIAHGVAEHIRRYDPFMTFLAERGFVAAGNDHLGHGYSVNSEEELGWFGESGGWSFVVGDMHRLHQKLKGEYPDVPIFLFGHSMGSFLSRTYAIGHGAELDGLVISGTGHQAKAMTTAGGAAARLEIRRHGTEYHSKLLNDLAFGGYNRGFSPARTESDWLSRDEAVVDAYRADPLCGFIPTAGLFRDMMGGIGFVTDRKNIRKMPKNLPVLFISGAADPVGENSKGVLRAYRAFVDEGMENVSLKLYPDARHEVLNETNRAEVYDDVLHWLERLV